MVEKTEEYSQYGGKIVNGNNKAKKLIHKNEIAEH